MLFRSDRHLRALARPVDREEAHAGHRIAAQVVPREALHLTGLLAGRVGRHRPVDRIALGEGLIKICAEPGMPSESMVHRWLRQFPEFREKYVRAREEQAHHFADEIQEIADKCRIGEKRTTKADGSVETVTADMVDRARLQIDARKWLMSKLAPKGYGDKQQLDVEVSGNLALALERARKRDV